ncbi:MAG: FAD:protein FMN transferase [Terriglobales bacterium]|jgi:thiamine biosynthesis lipoprotein
MKSSEMFVQSRNAMGTVFSIYMYARDEEHAETCFEAAFEEIERLEETLSHYRPSSELSRINRLAAHHAVTTDPEVFALLETAIDYSRRSNGAFDITVGPLMRAWGFFRGEGRYPQSQELQAAREHVGFEKVHLDVPTRTLRFAVPGVELDLGAIGKGYAVDRAVIILREAGIDAALVDAGSSTLYAMGAPPAKDGWTVRVPEPRDRSQTISTVTLRNESLSTSGSYEKCFELEGQKYCHVMDPRNGMPVQGVLQATLISSDSTSTDALSNAMFVMGPRAGIKLIATVVGSRGLWIMDEGESQRLVRWCWPDCSANGGAQMSVLQSKERTQPGR